MHGTCNEGIDGEALLMSNNLFSFMHVKSRFKRIKESDVNTWWDDDDHSWQGEISWQFPAALAVT